MRIRKIAPYVDFDGKTVWRCGKCGCRIFYPSDTQSDENEMNYYKYCAHCGRPIKWTKWPYEYERKQVRNFDY